MIALPWILLLLVLLLLAVLALPGRSRPVAIPLADTPSLRHGARRTSVLRAGIAALLVGLLAVSTLLVDRPKETIADFLSPRSSTVVVLDFSTSISDLVYGEIARTLQGIVDSGDERKIGLVFFSEVAEEALPPDTSAAELEPFIRFFRPKEDPAARPRPYLHGFTSPGAPSPIQYPFSPWLRKFSSGTRISSGLQLAREAIQRDGVEDARVLLISDLAEDKSDLPRLIQELTAYVRSAIDLQVVGLPPSLEGDQTLYRQILGERRAVVESTSLASGQGSDPFGAAGVAWGLIAVIVLMALGLGAGEFLGVPLRWRATTGEEKR